MSTLESINFSFSSSPFIIAGGVILVGLYVYYIYKYTVPRVSAAFRYFLIGIRTISLLLILFLLFEPVLRIEYSETKESKNLFFIDNSKSVTAEDSITRHNAVTDIVNRFIDDDKNIFYTFGDKINQLSSDSIFLIDHKEISTDLSKIFSYINSSTVNINTITLLSDGIATEGANPVYDAENIGVPVFTIGIGDSTDKLDVQVKKINSNEYIYSDETTIVEAEILQNGFNNKNTIVSLFENDKSIASKNIQLSESGINRIQFEYKPSSPGEKILTVKAVKIKDEYSEINNRLNSYINVLDKKVKVLIVSGSPSSDLSFIKNSLEQDDNLNVESLVQLSSNKFSDGRMDLSKIDSADILFLIGFPSANTEDRFVNKVFNAINKNKPFFILFSDGTNYRKFNLISSKLPVTISGSNNFYSEVQPIITDENSSLLKSSIADYIMNWNNLPPIEQPRMMIKQKPESSVIANSKFKGVPTSSPLIITRSAGRSKSICVTGKNIFKWKLHSENITENIFDSFIHNSVEWLNTAADNPLLIVKTTKKEYQLGSEIEFTAQVYDENLNPLNNADLQLTVKNSNNEYSVNMNSTGSGMYEGFLEISEEGIYNFYGKAVEGTSLISETSGAFRVIRGETEYLNLKMNSNMLKLIANVSGGKYFNINESNALNEMLTQYDNNQTIKSLSTEELNLWSDLRILIFVILLMGIEWFFRKRTGML